MKQTEPSLLQRLAEYHKTAIPMHMPGHKRNTALLGNALPYAIDITEIDGFDNLHDMHGVLKTTADLAAALYGSLAAFPLVGGSTCGILASVHAMVPFGARVLVARNCHRSVYHAIKLHGLRPSYICPDTDEFGICRGIAPEAVDHALSQESDISLVIITSPTYEGVTSNLSQIAAVCHRHNALLLVDAAHGAHLGLFPSFGAGAVGSGADVVVMSLHKTLPALTQTALLHICSDRIDPLKIKESLSVFETSSPSYVLLSSIDACLRWVQQNGSVYFSALRDNLSAFYYKTAGLSALSVLRYDDPSKIVVSTKHTARTGTDLANTLRKQFSIEVEMAAADYVLAMTSICDKKEHFESLALALQQIDEETPRRMQDKKDKSISFLPEIKEIPFEANQRTGTFVALTKAEGLECLESVWAYPPGIPLIVPGEAVSGRLIAAMEYLRNANVALNSTKGQMPTHLWVRKP